jgi:hypothetical protein
MAKSKLRQAAIVTCEKPYKPGQKVKVYTSARFRREEIVRYGEIVGIRQSDRKILLTEHPSFKELPITAFDHFREANQVVFIDDLIVSDIAKAFMSAGAIVHVNGKEVRNG